MCNKSYQSVLLKSIPNSELKLPSVEYKQLLLGAQQNLDFILKAMKTGDYKLTDFSSSESTSIESELFVKNNNQSCFPINKWVDSIIISPNGSTEALYRPGIRVHHINSPDFSINVSARIERSSKRVSLSR